MKLGLVQINIGIQLSLKKRRKDGRYKLQHKRLKGKTSLPTFKLIIVTRMEENITP